MRGGLEASRALSDLIFLALDQGITRAERGGRRVSFVFAERGGDREMHRFDARDPEAGLAGARETVDHLPRMVLRYAIAHDGFVTLDGERCRAILVEAGERGQPEAYLYAQRYTPRALFRRLRIVGSETYLGTTTNRFR